MGVCGATALAIQKYCATMYRIDRSLLAAESKAMSGFQSGGSVCNAAEIESSVSPPPSPCRTEVISTSAQPRSVACIRAGASE